MPTPAERLKRFLANRGTGFSTEDIAELLAENERLRAAQMRLEADMAREPKPDDILSICAECGHDQWRMVKSSITTPGHFATVCDRCGAYGWDDVEDANRP